MGDVLAIVAGENESGTAVGERRAADVANHLAQVMNAEAVTEKQVQAGKLDRC